MRFKILIKSEIGEKQRLKIESNDKIDIVVGKVKKVFEGKQ